MTDTDINAELAIAASEDAVELLPDGEWFSDIPEDTPKPDAPRNGRALVKSTSSPAARTAKRFTSDVNEAKPKTGRPKTGQQIDPLPSKPDGSSRRNDSETFTPIQSITVSDLREQFPDRRPEIVSGLIRQGETANIIASSKVGKSWLAYLLAITIRTGGWWLGQFQCTAGNVLIIDNELHQSDLAFRIPKVGTALNLKPMQYDDIEVWPLRGNLRSIYELRRDFQNVAGVFDAILIDAKYRIQGGDENSNDDQTRFYNEIDRIAAITGAAIILVHHASKGSQTDKRVTDVGSGAGAQSRATDCHIVLREHEEQDVVVLEAAVRSFKPVEPVALRWQFPLWTPAHDIDPMKLKGRLTQREVNQKERDRERIEKITTALADGPMRFRDLRRATGISRDTLTRVLDHLESQDAVTGEDVTIKGNRTREFTLAETNDK